MEIKTMFWLIAGLAFVSVIVLVGVSLSGTLLQLQSCSPEDIYIAVNDDDDGSPCGEDLYCSYAKMTVPGARGTIREKDACVDAEDNSCCRTCYVAKSLNNGVACGTVEIEEDGEIKTRTLKCLNSGYDIPDSGILDTSLWPDTSNDICVNPETHRCCRDWPYEVVE
ncbi:MAG: hypothetical protein GOV02_01000 [Candidatus Aenigmarchaeota archaeon]|nr:hypothetical protein [Candidatus Aenigmarchaeota archaeon]